MESYHIRVEGKDLTFSAAHFIVLQPRLIESLHGHDFTVAVEWTGSLGEHGYVVDFCLLRETLRGIVSAWDHKILLPSGHPEICLDVQESQVDLSFHRRRWSFPHGDCVVLPILNTTAECLAREIGDRLLVELARVSPSIGRPDRLRIELDEGTGNRAMVEWKFEGEA